jgi:hypothetical protein
VALLTIVEHYITAAMNRAVPERLEDGTVAATVPECPGVIAFGADNHACATELYARLEDCVKVSLAAGQVLPVIDGIDLNTEAGQILAPYHDHEPVPSQWKFYADEDELEAAFEARSREA